MNEIIKNRSEIVFLYDITDANPNGDPADSNKPRIDESCGINLVTDVRLKRTIRDYILKFKGQEIFVRKVSKEDGSIAMARDRAKEFSNNPEKIISECIDVRLFGGTIPISDKKEKGEDKGSITLTGPVQFNMGRSLHRVEIKHIKGTGAFAAKPGAKQQTFREEYILPYSIIGFHGIINENAATDTSLTTSDIEVLMDSIWNGTENLITRSKFGQVPRLLIEVMFKEENFHIGELNKSFKLVLNPRIKDEEDIRSLDDFHLQASDFVDIVGRNKAKIHKIRYKENPKLRIFIEDTQKSIKEILKNLDIDHDEFEF